MQGDSPTDPAPPAGLVDVSQSVALEFSKNDFNPRTNALSVEVIVVNRGPVTLAGPFLLRTTRIESTLGIVASTEKLDETANDCQFKPHSYVIRQRSLVPGGRSPPTRVSIRLRDIRKTDSGEIDVALRVCGHERNLGPGELTPEHP